MIKEFLEEMDIMAPVDLLEIKEIEDLRVKGARLV